MKIIELKFTNINNLKGGPHTLSFEEEPLKSAGLFGILGPTGSGKSTLLDVITLALFNRIPRFNKQISKKEISELGSVMTHHTDHAEASITYQIKNKTYTSKWTISKARTGNLRDYDMNLIDDSGEYKDLKKSEVPFENERLIGLSYDQFIKSIILSQGEFAKFLKATKNERGLLLEKITGASIYREIGKTVFATHKEKNEQLKSELNALDEIKVKTKEEVKQLKIETDKLENETEQLTQNLNGLASLKTIKENIRKNKLEADALNNKQKDIQFQIDQFKPQHQQIILHQKLLPIKSDLLKLKEGKIAIDNLQKEILNDSQNLKVSKKEFNDSLTELATLTNQTVSPENFKTVMSKFEDEVKSLSNEVANVKQKGQEERTRINQKLERAAKDQDIQIFKKINNPKEALNQIDSANQELSRLLSKANLNTDSKISDIRSDLELKRKSQKYLHNLIRLYESKNKIEVDLKKYVKKIDLETLHLQEYEPKLHQTILLLDTTKALLISQQNEEKNSIKIAKLEQLRSELINDEPCPLCGSLSHPYKEHNHNVNPEAFDIKIRETSQKLQHLELEKTSLEKTITQHQTTIKNLTQRVAETKKDLNLVSNEILNIRKNISESIPEDHKEIIEISEMNDQNIEQLDSAIIALEKVSLYTELKHSYQSLLDISKNYKVLHTKLKDKYSGENVSLDCNKVQDKFTASQRSIENLEKSIAQSTKNIKSLKEDIEKLEIVLSPKREQLGFNDFQLMLSSLLNEDNYNKLKEKDDHLNSETIKIQTQITAVQKELTILLEKDKNSSDTLEDIQTKMNEVESRRNSFIKKIGENTATLESEKLLNDRRQRKQKKIETLKSQLDNWSLMNNLIGDAKGNNFANFAQGLTLQNLLSLANKRLKKLSDRYLLDKPKNDELQIIDLYQGNIQRSVSTLSGGETFLISLALALSLSDMASKNVPLESLFIDEGFGTLDQDTLDIALSTLEKLQSESQKTIGIISHVEALKERIDVQIHLDKNAQGYSKIRIQS